ncbi:alpha/beta fold hydrolase [Cellulomonas alba]|uniref:AB hydrolase-1 domain-containing protein n=1 Tax=Cellulomonas alba TaxID=3053467 RepID=A0ABT7SCQ7_9CELL|nr:hypothetical protein [Cellulomonas alba]MDM7853921.1 hypothetical protein [Cellulomonas alba]
MHVVLVHGAAVDPAVWEPTARAIAHRTGLRVETPARPQSGDLDTELAFLAPWCVGAYVIGVSGGATLGLELAARGAPLAGALLHEPAAGSLAPGLLRHVVQGFADDGVAGFGRALYGPTWDPTCTTADSATVGAELAMFRNFEPRPFAPAVNVVLTVGANSPPPRYASVRALSDLLGVPWRIQPGVGHAAHLEGGYLPGGSTPELDRWVATRQG